MHTSPKTLADYTSPALIVPSLQSKMAGEVIAELCLALQREGRLTHWRPFYDAVMTREQLGSTCFPPGWAIPHARLIGLTQVSYALGRTLQPLAWFGSGIHIHTVFLFAIPEVDASTYLSLIAAVAKLNQNDAFEQRLQRAQDSKTMLEVLAEVTLRTQRPNGSATCATK